MTIIPSIPYNLTNGSLADASQVMADFNTIVADVNARCAANGANGDITSLSGLTTPLSHAQGGTALFSGGTSTGSANAQVVATTTPNSFALTDGNIVSFIAGYSNSGAMTLDVGGTGVTAVQKVTSSGLVALVGGEVIAGCAYMMIVAGGVHVIMNPTLPSALVSGSGSSTDGDVAVYNGATGVLIKDTGVALSSLALLASPTFTGTPAAPTAANGTNTTQLATTAFVQNAIAVNRQVFTASGTWTKPSGYSANAMVLLESWGAGGGGGSAGGGGGGGSYKYRWVLLSSLGATESIVIGAGGSAGGGNGGNSSIGSWLTAFGGAGGANASSDPGGAAGGYDASPSGGVNDTGGEGYGGTTSTAPQGGFYTGGGGGGYGGNQNGAASVYGGGGGAGGTTSHSGGASSFGGNGGNNGSAGVAPGGGGGSSGGAGARGEVRITIFAGGG